MRRALSHFPLRVQIGSLVALAVTVLAVCAVVIWLARGTADRAQAHKDQEAAVAEQAALLDASLLVSRRNERDFLQHRDTKYIVRHDEAIGETNAALDAITGVLPPADPRRAKVDIVRQGVAAYVEMFHKMVETETRVGLSDNDGLLGTVHNAAHQVEISLKGQDDLRLTVILMQMRRHERDFFTHHGSEFVERFVAAANDFVETVPYTAFSEQIRQQALARLADYRRDFMVASEAVLTSAATVSTMSDSYGVMAPTIRDLVLSARLRMVALQAVADRAQLASGRVIAATLAIGLLVMAGVGSLIARSIYRPLAAMTETMESLAHGRLNVAIPGTERRDELSKMGHALLVFRTAMADSERARATMEEERRRSDHEKVASLEAAAYVDSLTGLSNRRHFDQTIVAEVERAMGQGHPLSLLMVDIDFFKRVNDTFGHSGGDAVLRHIARLLREEARRCDVAARYGGEEFAIILPATGRSLTRLVAERLRATVEEAQIELGEGRVANMTISIGLATLQGDGGAMTLAERADAALYRAKQNGRNRVEEW
jgi:methyl-accepting chemotaxis protein